MSATPPPPPPPPPPKTHSTSPPQLPPYHTHPSQSLHQYPQSKYSGPPPPFQLAGSTNPPPPPQPPRPPSHPTLTYAEQQAQSPPQFYDPRATDTGQVGPVELGGDEHAAFTAGRAQGSADRQASEQLQQAQPEWGDAPNGGDGRSQDVIRSRRGADESAPQNPAGFLPSSGWIPTVLKSKNKQDLEHLLQNPTLLTGVLHHPSHAPDVLSASNTQLRTHLQATSQLAQQAARTAGQVQQMRDQVQAHLLRARAAEQAWRRKEKEMEDALEAFGPRALHRRLAGAVREGEEGLGVVVESWLAMDGVVSEREVQEWVKGVREGRKVVELRKERRGRWDEGRVGGWR